MLYDNDKSANNKVWQYYNDTLLTVLTMMYQSNANNDVTNPYDGTSNNFIEQQ